MSVHNSVISIPKSLYNIEKDATFVSPATSNYKGRLAVYKSIETGGKKFQNNEIHRLKQRATGTLYFYDKREKRCAETSQTHNYVKGVYSCEGKTEQNFTWYVDCSAAGISIIGGKGYIYMFFVQDA